MTPRCRAPTGTWAGGAGSSASPPAVPYFSLPGRALTNRIWQAGTDRARITRRSHIDPVAPRPEASFSRRKGPALLLIPPTSSIAQYHPVRALPGCACPLVPHSRPRVVPGDTLRVGCALWAEGEVSVALPALLLPLRRISGPRGPAQLTTPPWCAPIMVLVATSWELLALVQLPVPVGKGVGRSHMAPRGDRAMW